MNIDRIFFNWIIIIMAITINDSITCNLNSNDLINISDYFKNMFSEKFSENINKSCNILLQFITSQEQWFAIEKLINSYIYYKNDMQDENFNRKLEYKLFAEPNNSDLLYYVSIIVYVLEYIQANDVIEFYLSNIKGFILESYIITGDNANQLSSILRCCNLFDLEEYNYIFGKVVIDKKYLNLKNSIMDSHINIDDKSKMLYVWSLRFGDYEKITRTNYKYMSINEFDVNDDINSHFWNNFKIKSGIWNDLLRYHLPNDVIISGGFIVSCLNDTEIEKYNDIDIWMLDLDKNNIIDRLTYFLEIIEKYLVNRISSQPYILIKESIINIFIDNEINIQIILSNKQNAQELLEGFDFDYLLSYIENGNLYMSTESLYSYTTKTTRNKYPKDLIKISRGMKAIKKGFTITNDKYGIEPSIINNTDGLDEHPEWLDTENKYVEFGKNRNRNILLLKAIYKSEMIVNDFKDIVNMYYFKPFINFDYNNFDVLSDNTQNSQISENNIFNENNIISNPDLIKFSINEYIDRTDCQFLRYDIDFNSFMFDTLPICINYKSCFASDGEDMLPNYRTIEYEINNKSINQFNYQINMFKNKIIDILKTRFSINLDFTEDEKNKINELLNSIELDFINNYKVRCNCFKYLLKINNKYNDFEKWNGDKDSVKYNNKYCKFKFKISKIIFYRNLKNIQESEFILCSQCTLIKKFDNKEYNDYTNFLNINKQ